MDLGLSGRIAVVTGGASGIGFAIAAQLVAEGVTVAIVDCNAQVLDEARQALGPNAPIDTFLVDVSDRSAFAACLGGIVEKHGRLDVLVNNAGIANFSPLVEMSDDDWQAVFDTNLGAVRTSTRVAVPLMRGQGGGAIVNVSSVVAERAQAGSSAYAASKAAIRQFTAVTAVEYGADNIRCNCVQLGPVLTKGTDQYRRDFPDRYALAAAAVPLKRWAQPQEVAQVVAFLASDRASFITGSSIPIDGGLAVAAAT
ncbi:MAG TPA: SDR family NAD(P)-dependent oxidoreductase [Novosphingobium sp.]